MTLPIVTTRTTGRTHLRLHADDAASLAMRAHPVETLCGRRIDGRPGSLIDGAFGTSADCTSCARIHNLRYH